MQLKEFRDEISNVINNAQLPIDAVYYVMKDIMIELETVYYNEIALEKQLKQEEEKIETDEQEQSE